MNLDLLKWIYYISIYDETRHLILFGDTTQVLQQDQISYWGKKWY